MYLKSFNRVFQMMTSCLDAFLGTNDEGIMCGAQDFSIQLATSICDTIPHIFWSSRFQYLGTLGLLNNPIKKI